MSPKEPPLGSVDVVEQAMVLNGVRESGVGELIAVTVNMF